MSYGDYQIEIYFQGLGGVLPSLPISFAELEQRAEAAMPPGIWSYVAGGAGDELTQRTNGFGASRPIPRTNPSSNASTIEIAAAVRVP